MRSQRTQRSTERGAALVGTSLGFLVFAVVFLIGVHLMLNLYARSLLQTAGYETARHYALHRDWSAAAAHGASFTGLQPRFEMLSGDPVRVSVDATAPGISLPGLSGLHHVHLTVTVRDERFRPGG